MRAAHDAGDHPRATERMLEAYGPEIYGFLLNHLDDDVAAREAYSRFAEDLWRAMETFEWRCSARGWCYTLARHAMADYRRQRTRRARREVPLSGRDWLRETIERTSTPKYLRSSIADRARALRAQLSEDDQTLLVLRVDKQLPWKDLAFVLHPDEIDGEASLVRISARLRKRFEAVKKRLRALAESEGLIGDGLP